MNLLRSFLECLKFKGLIGANSTPEGLECSSNDLDEIFSFYPGIRLDYVMLRRRACSRNPAILRLVLSVASTTPKVWVFTSRFPPSVLMHLI